MERNLLNYAPLSYFQGLLKNLNLKYSWLNYIYSFLNYLIKFSTYLL